MSKKNSYTTAEPLEWNDATALIRALARNQEYQKSMLFAIGCFMGLRISDILRLRWLDILNEEDDGKLNTLLIQEKKTSKQRIIKINQEFLEHAQKCYEGLGRPDKDMPIFYGRNHKVWTIQWVNCILKQVRSDYPSYFKGVKNFSSHSLRKTFGKQIYLAAGNNAEDALVRLSQIFGHSSTSITRRYIGITQETINNCYDMLNF